MHQAYDPYIAQGQESMGDYSAQLQKLLSDPTALMQLIGSHYKESPGYQHTVDAATQVAQRAGAARGEYGAPSVQQALGEQIAKASSADYGDYMNRALGLYNKGLQGERGLTGMGFQASSGLAQNLADALMSRGNLAYSGAQQQNEDSSSLFGGLAQLASFL